MQITHIALWTECLEELRDFYVRYFGGTSNELYVNEAKGFKSYFISFNAGCSLELISRGDIHERTSVPQLGFCHIAFACRNREEVLTLTERLRTDGYTIAGEPRTSGDGYFESVVEDPDGNLVELVFR